VAILLYLKNLLEKNVSEFYVDRPFGDNSFDVYLVDKAKNHHIYEIKSGSKFQESKEKISDSMEIFHRHFASGFSNTFYYLVVKKDFRNSLARIWADIDTIKTVNRGRNFTEAKNRLKTNLKINGLSLDALLDLLKKVKIDTYYDDKLLSEEVLTDDIDSLIEKTLEIVLTKYPIRVHDFDYPMNILASELQMIVLRYAGFDDNLHLRFIKSICNYVAHHKMMEEYPSLPSGRQTRKDYFLNEITSEFVKEYGLDAVIPAELDSPGRTEAEVFVNNI
jgi:hypothetical protein